MCREEVSHLGDVLKGQLAAAVSHLGDVLKGQLAAAVSRLGDVLKRQLRIPFRFYPVQNLLIAPS